MAKYRKPFKWRDNSLVIGDSPILTDIVFHRRNTAQKNATKLKRKPTPAEKAFRELLDSLGDGVLRGKFIFQWVFQTSGFLISSFLKIALESSWMVVSIF
ncbi:MAG: hypothetical protein ACP5SH_25675 [Syntrophobacteraceae bacterium]